MSDSRKRIVVLGSTGSIGTQTLDIARRHPDKLEVVGITAFSHMEMLAQQAAEFGCAYAVVADASDTSATHVLEVEEAFDREARIQGATHVAEVSFGPDAIIDLVCDARVDMVVNALVGAAGLRPSYEALRAGKVLALANKESLVVGGDLIMPLATGAPGRGVAGVEAATRAAARGDALGVSAAGFAAHHMAGSLPLVPIDSEHGAIFQCLVGERVSEVSRLWVTASGGPFRGRTRGELQHVTPKDALKHPTWNMGAKISIDSSTLMNKGLEVIEAHHLFGMPYEQIEVVVQPQSAVHSMVEFSDGSVKAHLGTTDMRIPIQYAITYPDRWETPVEPLDFRTLGSLEFAAPDTKTFRCLDLARAAGMRGGTLPCAMNAANEVAVAQFLAGNLSYLGIAEVIEQVMDRTDVCAVESVEQLANVDAWARNEAHTCIASR